MNYSIAVDPNLKIIRYKHSGCISQKELNEVWNTFMQMHEFSSDHYGILVDYRGAEFNFTIDDLDPIWGFLESIKNILRNKRESILVDSPMTLVMAHLFELEFKKRIGYEIKIFSTEPGALGWLA